MVGADERLTVVPPRAPATITTERLALRRPALEDTAGVYAYASDPDLTRYMSWARHTSLADTEAFLTQAIAEWNEVGVGTYLITDPATGEIMGSTGLHQSTPYRSVTGYILTGPAWGKGFATEACRTMVALANRLGFARIEADCHVEHRASARVLEKAGMLHEGVLRSFLIFPNLDPTRPHDVHIYGLALH
jgi:[ribosomal protein S5]-alanine N-acetyltransferase